MGVSFIPNTFESWLLFFSLKKKKKGYEVQYKIQTHKHVYTMYVQERIQGRETNADRRTRIHFSIE